MNSISLIKQVLLDQQAEITRISNSIQLVERDLGNEEILGVFQKGPGVIVIQGVRRCGKSTYAIQALHGKQFVYLNFDDERLIDLKAGDFNTILTACYELYGTELEYFIFDEIQNIKGWELFISRIEKTKKIVITGSNANLLSSELATHLTGRYKLITLYPFSFREFIRLKDSPFKVSSDANRLTTKEMAQYRLMLSGYIAEGGFPDVQKFGKLHSQTIYSDIISKDIIQRYKIRRTTAFKKLANYIISNTANEISLTKVGKLCGIQDAHTSAKYFDYLEQTYIICPLIRYFHKLKAQLTANKKSYAIDSGLVNTTAFRPSSLLSAHYENLVYLELLRQRDYMKNLKEIFFWQDSSSEVDFLVRFNEQITAAIQVSRDISRIETREREVKSLVNIHRSLGTEHLYLITDSLEEEIRVEQLTVRVVPLWKWLLNPELMVE